MAFKIDDIVVFKSNPTKQYRIIKPPYTLFTGTKGRTETFVDISSGDGQYTNVQTELLENSNGS